MKLKLIIIIIVAAIILSSCNGNNSGERIEGTGTIEFSTSIISSKVSGTVLSIPAKEGCEYKKGDTLIIVDHEVTDMKYLQAQAARDAAKAKYDQLVNGSRKEDISMAEEQMNQSKINYNLAAADFERMKSLIDEKAITQKQFDDADSRFQLTKSLYNTAEKNYEKIKNISRKEDIDYAKAMLVQAEAALSMIKKNLDDCFVTAPFDGTLLNILIENGENTNPGSALYKFANTKTAEIIIYIPETEIGLIKTGQSAEIFVDSFEDKPFKGKVTFISPEAEFTPKNIQTKDERTKLVYGTKILIENSGENLKAGMPADAEIIINAGN